MTIDQGAGALAGYDLHYDADGGYTTGTIRVVTEPITASTVLAFLHGGVVRTSIELPRGCAGDHRLVLETALAPELRAGAVVVESSRYGGGSTSYYSTETTPGHEAVRVGIDVTAALQRLLAG